MARALAAWLVALAAGATQPVVAATAYSFSDGPRSTTCGFFDKGAGVRWIERRGDWADADGRPHGERAFAVADAPAGGPPQVMEWDLTALVGAWKRGALVDHGVMLRVPDGASGRGVVFQSRESALADERPRLVVQRADGTRVELEPVADTQIDCTTIRPLGALRTLAVNGRVNALLRFDLDRVPDDAVSAQLRLTTFRQYGRTTIGAYRVAAPFDAAQPPLHAGLATGRPPAAMAGDPDVVLHEDFERDDWRRKWTHAGPKDTLDVVAGYGGLGFVPLDGRALRARIPKGRHLGLDLRYAFADRTGSEPEELWLRYYLRLADDFRPTVDGGKLPGLSGTYDQAGWGGRRSDGTNGWSMRGGFDTVLPDGHPLAGQVAISTYAYHADMTSAYGDHWPWSLHGPGTLERNRWYCLEQHVRLNEPGQHDGVMQAWIDGRLALDRRDVRYRERPDLRIEMVWMNVYHGGAAAAPRDMHVFVDAIVAARRPVGCR